METTEVIEKVSKTLVVAGSTFRQDKIEAYEKAILRESNIQSRWVMEKILENAQAAEQNQSPLCDDTGIPHLFLELGPNQCLNGKLLEDIQQGVAEGLRTLPGRPMAILGNDEQRLDQSGGINTDSSAVLAAPILIRNIKDEVIRLHIIMQGGGPAIRGRSYRVFHRHNVETVVSQIVEWGKEAVSQLGCSPCTLAVGIGRSHYEASALMLEAQVYGRFDMQSNLETEITSQINKADIGALGLHGDTSVLATFLRVGPQRASGVRIVCMRPCCCFEPRIASVEL